MPAGHMEMVKTFAPRLDRSEVTLVRRPSTRAIIVTTVVTPMTTPSSVRSERSGLEASVPSASRVLSHSAMKRGALIRSFVAQRLDRIEPGGAGRRPDAEEEPHQSGEENAPEHGERLDRGGEAG